MSNPSDNPPAFPRPASPADFVDHCQEGMSLRDYFAAKAMQAIIETCDNPKCKSKPDDTEGIEQERKEFALEVARHAYRAADAMLAARTSK